MLIDGLSCPSPPLHVAGRLSYVCRVDYFRFQNIGGGNILEKPTSQLGKANW